MPVNLELPTATAVPGISLSTVSAGIKADGSPDLVLIQLPEHSTTAAVFTRNTFCAAPVIVAREHLRQSAGATRALLVNSGNANAGTGQEGLRLASQHCMAIADALAVPTESVLPFSTGVIGEQLPHAAMLHGIDLASSRGGSDHAAWEAAARGIMTTDTEPKLTSQQFSAGEPDSTPQTVTITGMSKGAGMIQPNMATMLAYVFVDARIAVADLQQALGAAVAVSFNAITVDSDTSTNDACVLSATGSGPHLTPDSSDWPAFVDALTRVCRDLAQAIVRDAEGATKFITVNVSGAADRNTARAVGYAVANSPLVKTAMFASDANVGRLLMAIGKLELDGLEADRIVVRLGDTVVFEAGTKAPGYTEDIGAAIMAEAEILVSVDLGMGSAEAEIYTSDLSHDYVSINADYRS